MPGICWAHTSDRLVREPVLRFTLSGKVRLKLEDEMAGYSRRNFLKTGLAAGALAGTRKPAAARGGRESNRLGNARKIRRESDAARLWHRHASAGKVQRDLGQDQFTRLVRYAYDNGIRFFETAEILRRYAPNAGRRAEGHSAR